MRLEELPKLQVLMVEAEQFTDVYLGKMPKLKGLMCYKCSLITDEEVANLLNSTSDIKELGIVDCPITLESTVIARQWTERTGKSLKLWVSRKFLKRYLASGGQITEKFKVVKFYQKPRHAVDWNSEWGLELVE